MMNCHTIVRTKLAWRTLNPSGVLIILTLLAVARGSANVSADDPKSLAEWRGNIRVDSGPTNGWCSPQSTSTVLLPDGAILTAFGTGHRNPMGAKVWLMDVALVRWRLAPATTTQPRD